MDRMVFRRCRVWAHTQPGKSSRPQEQRHTRAGRGRRRRNTGQRPSRHQHHRGRTSGLRSNLMFTQGKAVKMDKLRIKGGTPLEGEVRISGAKNSALPAMAASLLTSGEVILENLPFVNDAFTTRRLLRELGAT